MFYGRIYFLEYISFRMTRLMRVYVLREVMLCRRKSFMGNYVLVGMHVFRMTYISICFGSLEDMFLRVCVIVEHVVVVIMSYMRMC